MTEGKYMKSIKVDAIGQACPTPVVMTVKAIEAVTEPTVVETLVDNEVAVSNLLYMAKNRGLAASSEKTADSAYAVRIEATGAGGCQLMEVEKAEEKIVVAITSDVMGSGSDELGRILIKGFIYTLTQMEKKPSAVIFYNSGVLLATEGPQLEDLKNLCDAGTEILSCGTCLEFFGVKEKLAVGRISNMYTIVETLSGATKVIRP